MRPRTIALVVGVLVLLTIALVALGLRSEQGLPDSVRITSVPDSYRIVYEVTTAGGPDQPETVTTEQLQVDRPFRSLSVVRTPGGELTSGRLSDLNRLLLYQSGQWRELQVPPAMAASDLRLDGAVLDALSATDEVRRVAGRACQVFTAGGPVSAGDIVPVGDGDDGESAEVCVDEAGLVLSEVWVDGDGALLRRREAVDVDLDPEFDADTFTVGDAEIDVVPATDGGGSAVAVDDDEPFGDRTLDLADDTLPVGFDRLGRWSIVRPRLDAVPPDPLADPIEGRVAGIATVWVRSADAIVLEQGGVAGGGQPFAPHPRSETVSLTDELGVAEVFTDGRGTELRAVRGDGTFVRVWSTLPRDEVIALARALVAK